MSTLPKASATPTHGITKKALFEAMFHRHKLSVRTNELGRVVGRIIGITMETGSGLHFMVRMTNSDYSSLVIFMRLEQ